MKFFKKKTNLLEIKKKQRNSLNFLKKNKIYLKLKKKKKKKKKISKNQ